MHGCLNVYNNSLQLLRSRQSTKIQNVFNIREIHKVLQYEKSKTCVKKSHSKIDTTNILMTNGSLMKVESIAESILQYF